MIYESLILVLNACSINVCSIKTITDDNGVLSFLNMLIIITSGKTILQLEIWANAQRDGRPAEYMWRPLFNAAKFG